MTINKDGSGSIDNFYFQQLLLVSCVVTRDVTSVIKKHHLHGLIANETNLKLYLYAMWSNIFLSRERHIQLRIQQIEDATWSLGGTKFLFARSLLF